MEQARARVSLVLVLVAALSLAVAGVSTADPDKDESGKGKDKQEERHDDREGGGEEEQQENDGAGEDKAGATEDGGSSAKDSGSGDRQGSKEAVSASDQPSSGSQRGNIPCSALDPDFEELKLQNPGSGTYSDGTLTVTLQRTGEGTFTWTSNIDVDAVIAKGGEDSNIYTYPGTSDGFSGSASTPTNPSNGKPYGLSHVSFCYDTAPSDVPTTPGSPTTPGTRPTTPGGPEGPEVPPEDEVLGDITTDDEVEGSAEGPGATTEEQPQTRGGAGVLPFTGAALAGYAFLGLILTLGGAALARRRRRHRSTD